MESKNKKSTIIKWVVYGVLLVATIVAFIFNDNIFVLQVV